jgi:parallel beta-helix repeat protein
MRLRFVCILAALCGCGGEDHPSDRPEPVELTIDRDDIDVTTDVRVKPGVYRVTDVNGDGVLRVKTDGVTVDLTGVTLVGSADGALPDSFEGTAVRVDGAAGVRIKGGTMRGYRGGIYLKDCKGVFVEGADVSDNRAQRLKSTPTRCDDGADWLGPHFNDKNEWWTEYGAGIYLDGCQVVAVTGCRGRRTQNGIVLRNTSDSFVTDNDMSWMSGWGIAMWRSSKNEISHNRCDYGVRGYSYGVYDRGQDSSGILMFEQCSDNIIAYNSATHGGDGIFMYAGHETTQRTGEGGCNRNLLYRNDFSHAVANAIECTFSDGNRFVENRLDDSNYGIWGGYSFNTIIAGNVCRDARVAGVAIEHGSANVIEGNVFEGCATGIEAWWDDDADLMGGIYGQKRHCRSEAYEISLNRFRKCKLGLRLEQTGNAGVVSNEFDRCSRVADLKGTCPDFRFDFNRVLGESPGWFRNDTGSKIAIGPCLWKDGKPADTDDVVYSLGPESLNLDFAATTHKEKEPDLHGKIDAMLPKDAKRGMKTIVVDEWGPCDPTVAKLFPARQTSWGEAEFFVFGPEGTWRVLECEGVDVRPTNGAVPGQFVAQHRSKGDVCEFKLVVETSSGARLSASGVLLRATWDVEFRTWKPAEGEHGGYGMALSDENWAAHIRERPLVKLSLPSLSTPWAHEDMPRDHFSTRARASMTFPAGKWRFATTSDDGVRVLVDGKKVIDNWTWHAPAPDEAVVELTEGPHTILVEHFEIDGAEALDFGIEPVK